MDIYTIYLNVPRAVPFLPFSFIAKRWCTMKESPTPIMDEKFHMGSSDIKQLRDLFETLGLTALNPSPTDDPAIVEIWL